MTAFLVTIGILALAASIGLVAAGLKWATSQLFDHDCHLDLDDFA